MWQPSWSYKLGCLSTAVGIIVGAAGGHNTHWPQERKDIFHKGLLYHFMNSVGMIFSSFNPSSTISSFLFGCGILLFCLPLYHRAFTDQKTLSGFLPPYGGFSMIFGWVLLAFRKWSKNDNDNDKENENALFELEERDWRDVFRL